MMETLENLKNPLDYKIGVNHEVRKYLLEKSAIKNLSSSSAMETLRANLKRWILNQYQEKNENDDESLRQHDENDDEEEELISIDDLSGYQIFHLPFGSLIIRVLSLEKEIFNRERSNNDNNSSILQQDMEIIKLNLSHILKLLPFLQLNMENVEYQSRADKEKNEKGLLIPFTNIKREDSNDDDNEDDNEEEDKNHRDLYEVDSYYVNDGEEIKDEDDEETHNSFICDMCDGVFKTASGLKTHKRRKHSDLLNKLNEEEEGCDNVDEDDKDVIKKKLKLENEDVDIPDDLFCPFCRKTFGTKSQYRSHITTCRKRVKCDVCGETFTNNNRLMKHGLSVHSVWNCEYCGKSFPSGFDCVKHKETDHPKDCLCPICGLGFVTQTKLNTHLYFDHKEISARKNRTKKGSMMCSICGKTFNEKSNLNNHIKLIHLKVKEYHCQICGKDFSMGNTLRNHILNVHEKKRLGECTICGKSFAQKSQAVKHMRTVHQKIKKAKCEICGNAYASNSHLKRHIKDVHENVRCFKCEVCGKDFTQKSNLDVHIRSVHGGIKNYPCHSCEKSFSTKQSLELHSKNVHRNVQEDNNI